MLHSFKDFEKCTIGATDGDIGQVKDLYFDDHAWAARYLVVDTGSWLSGRKVLISPICIQKPGWQMHRLAAAIAYDTSASFDRQRETGLYTHYGRPPCWKAGSTLEREI